MRRDRSDFTKNESGLTNAEPDDSTDKISESNLTGEEGKVKWWLIAIWFALTNQAFRVRRVWLSMQASRLRWRNRRVEEQLRRHGIDPDSLPGIPELKQQMTELERQRAEDAENERRRKTELKAKLWEQSKRDAELWVESKWPRWFR